MATYQFQCIACMEYIEVEHDFDEPHPETHEECGGMLNRVFIMPNIIYRSGGFQTTDKRLEKGEDDDN